MKQAGWNIDVGPFGAAKDRQYRNCMKYIPTFFGYKNYREIGRISADFKGEGKATLNFGNCNRYGETKVFLNNVLISSAAANQNSRVVNFDYKPKDTLKLEEFNKSVIKINALQLRCKGQIFVRDISNPATKYKNY